jgi:hypothetical protein
LAKLQPAPFFSGDSEQYVSTGHLEGQNLSLRTEQRRFTRLTIGFSKDHAAAVASYAEAGKRPLAICRALSHLALRRA